jgi:hypothetical protein
MTYVFESTPGGFTFESSGVDAGLWPGVLWQLIADLQNKVKEGIYELALDVTATQAGVQLFSLHMGQDGSIRAKGNGALTQSMFPLPATITDANGPSTLTINLP